MDTISLMNNCILRIFLGILLASIIREIQKKFEIPCIPLFLLVSALLGSLYF